ncbi:MAG: GAF domain-containing protein [Bacteroidota bacterium]
MLVRQVADQLSLALENARLFQETQKRAEQMALMNRIVTSASASLDIRENLREVAREITAALSLDASTLALLTPQHDALEVVAHFGLTAMDTGLGSLHLLEENPVLRAVLESGQPLVLTGIPGQQLSQSMRAFLEPLGTQTLAILPMTLKGRPIGLVGLHLADENRLLPPADLTLAETICSQISTAVENARLFQDVQDRVTQQEAITQITEAALAALNMQDLARSVHAAVNRVLPAGNFFIALYDSERDLISFPYSVDEIEQERPSQRPGRGLASYVIRTGKALLATPEVYAELERNGEVRGSMKAIDWLGVPLRTSRAVRGVMAIQSYDPAVRLTERHLEILTLLGAQAGAAIERLQAREALSKSEADLRALFASMEDVVLVVDREARYLRIAPTNPSRLIRPAEELLGRLMEEFVPAETAARFKQAIAQTLETGETVQMEYDLPLEGQTYWFLANLSRLDSDTVFWVARDITNRKKAEEELAKFKLGIETSGDAVFLTDAEGRITYANSAFETVYGYKPEEVIGKTPRVIKSGLMSREDYEQFWATLLSKQAVTGEIINRAKDGSLVTIAGTNSAIVDENGDILGFLAVHHDITESKRVEAVLQRRNTYLAASSEIGRLITSTLDLQTILSRTVNLVAERFGYYHAAIFLVEETRFYANLQEATGEAGKVMKARGHRLAVGSTSVVGEASQTGSVVLVNDTEISAIHKHNPLLPDTRAEAAIPLRVGNRIIGVLDIQSVATGAFSEDDIGVLQTLADQVAVAIDNARSYELSLQAVREMREVDRLKSQFLANMSHELRTPLNSIIGFSRVILKGIDGPVTELQQNDLTAIYNSGQHLLGLINDILDLSKIEAGKMDLAFEEVNAADVISSVLPAVMGLIKDKPIRLVKRLPDNLPHVRADPIRVRQILLNLFSNAAKFTDEGEITVAAALEDDPANGAQVRISVTDTGTGIDEKDQSRLFQAFSQVDDSPTRKTGGSGLGLSISHRLVEMHGGQIGVRSQVGQGSTFYFTLPVYRQAASEGRAGRLVLAIDDDPQVLGLYERYLHNGGYHAILLTDPSKAIERVAELKPFAVTLDIMMPGIDGWQVLASLKANPETRDVPVIICSIIEEQDRGFNLGAADYLVKPILENDLIQAIARLNGGGLAREILVIGSDPNDISLMGRMLSDEGHYKPVLAVSAERAWDAMAHTPPQAVVLDLSGPGGDELHLLERMRSTPALETIPVVLVSGADLTPEQRRRVDQLGQPLLSRGSLTAEALVTAVEIALNRLRAG